MTTATTTTTTDATTATTTTTDAPTGSSNSTQEFVYAVGGVGIAFAIIKVRILIGGGTRGAKGATAPQISKYMLSPPPDFHIRN